MRLTSFSIALCLSLSAWAMPAASRQAPGAPDPLLDRARQLHRQVPLIDGHNDYPWRVREVSPVLDLVAVDIRGPQPQAMTDIPRLRAGGVGGQFWSVYVPTTYQGQDAVRLTLEQIDVMHRMIARYPDVFERAGTAADVERIFKAGRIASMAGVEGGHAIDSSLGTLRMFYDLGARYMTLTHSRGTPWADAAGETTHGGLTSFGEEVVGEMNWLGMLVDLSHVAPETMDDAIRVARAPVIFSHSNARALCDVPRNVPDSVLKQLPKNGGVAMVTFVPGFTSQEAAGVSRARFEEYRRLQQQHPNDDEAVRKGVAAWRAAHPEPAVTIGQVADHIDHIRKVAGIDHVGIGSDFDGIDSTPVGLEDVSKYPALTAELLRRGYSDTDAKKVLGLNVLRVMREAERVAAAMRKERGPSTAALPSRTGSGR